MGKVGKGGRGRDEGYGKWVELADLPTLHTFNSCKTVYTYSMATVNIDKIIIVTSASSYVYGVC